MYQSHIKSLELFKAQSEGYGDPITTFGRTQEGETPVSLVNIALAACVTMCVQGYYASQEQKKQVPVEVGCHHFEDRFHLRIFLEQEIGAAQQEKILAYIDTKCKVKALLREDLQYTIEFAVLDELAPLQTQ